MCCSPSHPRPQRSRLAIDASSWPALDVDSLFAAETRAHLLGGGEQAEHRQATVAFLEFSGIDALSEEQGAEARGRTASTLSSAAAEEAAARYGVDFHGPTSEQTAARSSSSAGSHRFAATTPSACCARVHEIVAVHPASSPVGLARRA